MNPDSRAMIKKAAEFIHNKDSRIPKIGLILGSGLGDVSSTLTDAVVMDYKDIPFFPIPSIEGHSGRLAIGKFGQSVTAVMEGRRHFYENVSANVIAFPIHLLHFLGCKYMIVTNLAGGLNPSFAPGDLMLIEDHLNLPGMCGLNPLIGDNFCPDHLFVNMNNAYDIELQAKTLEIASKLNIPLKKGIYAMVSGPSYETMAEAKFLRLAGASAVGMSTAPEVIVARQNGMKVIGFSCIANMVGLDAQDIMNHSDFLEIAKSASLRLALIIRKLAENLL